MTHTEHYELSQWQKSDRLMMSDFNADNQKLDAALATMPHTAAGSFAGSNSTTTVEVGFAPKLVFLAFPGSNTLFYVLGGKSEGGISLTATGFTVPYISKYHLNEEGYTYYYAAIG